ncbi:MAG: glycosyltransferase family 9 protein [Candidatus Riflebacteria bacterium]|nr:glycosyltransferase family 9 protein [Candidatus Riflebacteria bacterium]
MGGILIIRSKGMGDIIHLISALRALREKFPHERIAFLCQKPFGSIIPASLNIESIEMPSHPSFMESLNFLKKIREQKFEKVFDLYGNMRTALISLFSGASQRNGFGYRVRKYAYNGVFVPPNPNKHLAELFVDFFNHFGMDIAYFKPTLEYSGDESRKADSIINSCKAKKPILGINIHATYPAKKWPTEYFLETARYWSRETGGSTLFFWGPGEELAVENALNGILSSHRDNLLPTNNHAKNENSSATNASIATNDRPTTYVASSVGSLPANENSTQTENRKTFSEKPHFFTHPPLNLNELIALIDRVDLFLTSDTGPMNIAWALGKPVTALFGPTTPDSVAPKEGRNLILSNPNLDCLRCHREICEKNTCMTEMKPEWVFNKIKTLYPEFFNMTQTNSKETVEKVR